MTTSLTAYRAAHLARRAAAPTAGAAAVRPPALRRVVSFLLSLAAALGLIVATSTAAHADGALPDCMHGNLNSTTSVSTNLPMFTPSSAGMTESQWLFVWTTTGWQWTGDSTSAYSYPGGIWMTGDRQVNSLDFYVRPGSGYYLVLEQITLADGSGLTFYQPLYRNVQDNSWSGYCQA